MLRTRKVLSVRLPGPTAPIFTGFGSASHLSVLTNSACLGEGAGKMVRGGRAEISKFAHVEFDAGLAKYLADAWLPVKWPIVSPSGLAAL